MINLLPPDEKKQLVAARTNTLLARYSVLLAVIIGLLALETLGMYFVIDAGTAQNQVIIQENEQKTAAYAGTKAEAQVFSSNLATAKYILDKRVPYTTLIFTLANSLPKGAVLSTVTLDPATFGTATTLTVNTDSYRKAIEVKNDLQNAKVNGAVPLFTSVSFQSVASGEDTNNKYPFTAIYNITYSKAVLTQ